jgi:hypothetical protein
MNADIALRTICLRFHRVWRFSALAISMLGTASKLAQGWAFAHPVLYQGVVGAGRYSAG